MKTKIVLLSMVIFTLIFCRSPKKAVWAGRIESENGMKVVINPSQPTLGEIYLDLEADLSIGREDDSNYLFYQPRAVVLDNKENIYVLDSGNQRIQKFDSKGSYVQTIGKPGQGPGEFERPAKLFIDSRNNLYTLDSQKIKVFDDAGNFIRQIILQTDISDFFLNKTGEIFGVITVSTEESKRAVIMIDSSGKITRTIAEFSDVRTVERKSEGGGLRFKVYHIYSPRVCLSPIDEKQFYYAYALDYELFIGDDRGNVFLKIKKEEARQPISQKEKEEIIKGVEEHTSRRGPKWPADVLEEACNFSSYRPFFYGLGIDDQQRLCVWRTKSVLDQSEEEELDLFSREGYYLYRIRTRVLPYALRKGFLYSIIEDQERGEVRVQRYRIKNWNEVR